MKPLVSVVTPTFNTIKRIGNHLNKLFCPHLVDDPNVEFVIWDNGSTDGTREYLCNIREKLGDRLTLFQNNENSGVNVAVKWVLENAKADHVFLFNDDYQVLRPKFYQPYIDFNTKAIISIPRTDKTYPKGLTPFKDSEYYIYNGVRSPQCFRPLYIPREILSKVDWDSNMFYAYSDLDFMLRAMELGYPLLNYTTDEQTIHRVQGHNPERLDLYHAHYDADTKYFYSKWAGKHIIPPGIKQ